MVSRPVAQLGTSTALGLSWQYLRASGEGTTWVSARPQKRLPPAMHTMTAPSMQRQTARAGSFAGNVTYPKSQDLAEAARRTPLDRLLVETDAPYLTPQVVRKERNRPAYVAHTARFIADLRGIPYAELDAAVEANAATLLGW